MTFEEAFTSPNYKPPRPENPYESEEYQRFVEEMAQHCHCLSNRRPCDGVLAGGPCDGFDEEWERRQYDMEFAEDEDEDIYE